MVLRARFLKKKKKDAIGKILKCAAKYIFQKDEDK